MEREELNSKEENTKNHYLANIKRVINLIKLYRKADSENEFDKMKYIEWKLKQMDFDFVCKQLHEKKYKEILHEYVAQLKVINYIEKEGFISPDFENVGLTYLEILKICKSLEKKKILKKRNCTGIAYEFNIKKE